MEAMVVRRKENIWNRIEEFKHEKERLLSSKKINYRLMNVPILHKLCNERKLKHANLTKDELIKLLEDNPIPKTEEITTEQSNDENIKLLEDNPIMKNEEITKEQYDGIIINYVKFDNIDICYINTSNDIKWYYGKNICNVLGIKDHKKCLQRIPGQYRQQFYIYTKGGPQNCNFINEDGLKIILITTRYMNNALILASLLNIDISNIRPNIKEDEHISNIIKAFNHEECIKQYCVGKYRIDLYLPKYKIVIECDEFNHIQYDTEKENIRTDYLKQIGCRLIRFNPDNIEFNIFDVISGCYLQLIIYKQHKHLDLYSCK